MKTVILSILCIYCAFLAKAQVAITLTGTGAMPIGELGKTASIGYGGGAGFHYFFQDQGSIGLQVGYLNFTGKDVAGITSPPTTMLSITPTMLFSFFMDDSPYLIIDAGGYFSTTSSISAKAYGGAVGLGYLYGLSDIMALNINAKYTAAYDVDAKTVTMFVPVNIGLLFILGGAGQSKFR